jgi:hypothetical protein
MMRVPQFLLTPEGQKLRQELEREHELAQRLEVGAWSVEEGAAGLPKLGRRGMEGLHVGQTVQVRATAPPCGPAVRRTAHPLTPATVQVQCDESAEAAAYWGLGLKPGATIYTGQVCRCVRCCSRVCVCACSQCAWGGAAQVMGWAEIDDEGQVKYEALELLEQRWSGSTAEWEYRVRWVGYGADADTWEREGSLPGGRRGELVRRFRQDRAAEAGSEADRQDWLAELLVAEQAEQEGETPVPALLKEGWRWHVRLHATGTYHVLEADTVRPSLSLALWYRSVVPLSLSLSLSLGGGSLTCHPCVQRAKGPTWWSI